MTELNLEHELVHLHLARPDMWSPDNPGQQIAWDASSFDTFLACPRKYLYTTILGYRRRHSQTDFGTVFHAARDAYCRSRARGLEHEEALDKAVDLCLKRAGHPVMEQLPDGTITTRWVSWNDPEAWVVMVAGVPTYPDMDNRRTAYALVRAVVWALDDEHKSGIMPVRLPGSEVVASELQFSIPLGVPTGRGDDEPFNIVGTIDRIGLLGDEHLLIDYKTTGSSLSSYYFASYDPNVQIATYDWAVWQLWPSLKVAAALIEATQLGVTFSRTESMMVSRSAPLREEWEGIMRDTILQASERAFVGEWPPNYTACMRYGGCQFRAVCRSSPDRRMAKLEQDFIRQPWNPLEAKESSDE